MSDSYQNIAELLARKPNCKVLLHCCCAPCAAYPVLFLADLCDLTLLYYNPNITDADEYKMRYCELVKLGAIYNILTIDGGFNSDAFYRAAVGMEDEPEGGKRCVACIEERIKFSANYAVDYDYFMTTLTISPRKNAAMINALGSKYPKYIETDFKKKNGYAKGVELSRQYGFYRQNYCGCEYSRRESK